MILSEKFATKLDTTGSKSLYHLKTLVSVGHAEGRLPKVRASTAIECIED